jgi:creatinine amidohydrolase
MQLAESTWTDAATLDTDLALLPVGSTEQHGPHAPLGTDHLAAEAIAAAGAAAYADSEGNAGREDDAGSGDDGGGGADARNEAGTGADAESDADAGVGGAGGGEVAIAPPIPVGIAEEHRQFPGTLWVSEDTFREYVGDVLRSLGASGFPRVVVVNGHGGNTGALREVCARVSRDGDVYAVPFTWFDALAAGADPDPSGDDGVDLLDGLGHGGPVETSLVWHVAPALVREERFPAAAEGAGERFGEWVAGTNLAYDFAEFAPSGNVGDPAAGDPERGGMLLERAGAALSTLLEAVEARDVSRPPDR